MIMNGLLIVISFPIAMLMTPQSVKNEVAINYSQFATNVNQFYNDMQQMNMPNDCADDVAGNEIVITHAAQKIRNQEKLGRLLTLQDIVFHQDLGPIIAQYVGGGCYQGTNVVPHGIVLMYMMKQLNQDYRLGVDRLADARSKNGYLIIKLPQWIQPISEEACMQDYNACFKQEMCTSIYRSHMMLIIVAAIVMLARHYGIQVQDPELQRNTHLIITYTPVFFDASLQPSSLLNCLVYCSGADDAMSTRLSRQHFFNRLLDVVADRFEAAEKIRLNTRDAAKIFAANEQAFLALMLGFVEVYRNSEITDGSKRELLIFLESVGDINVLFKTMLQESGFAKYYTKTNIVFSDCVTGVTDADFAAFNKKYPNLANPPKLLTNSGQRVDAAADGA